MTPDEYQRHDALALGALVAAREVSAADVAKAAIATIEAFNPRLNAVVATRFEAALAEAEALDRGGDHGPLAGVPFLLKDVNLQGGGLPTRHGSRFFADAPAGPDDTLVARWRAAGLVVFGKTNTPEFAGEFVTEPRAYGPALNPWDTGATVGGSSGGAAVAVAAGMVSLAHGTDLGGSIRIPAACCGVFGFKPSVGLNPLGPDRDEIASGLDADHALARTVRDSAAALDAGAGPDAGARGGRAPPPGGYLAALDGPSPRLRIGLALDDPQGRRVGPAQAEAAVSTARLLEDRGHRVEPYAFPPEAEPAAWFDHLWGVDVLHLVRERADALGREPRKDELEPLTWAVLGLVERLSALDLHRARLGRDRAARAILLSMDGLDAVLSPALAEDPPPLGALGFDAFGGDLAAWAARGYAFAPFAAPANLAGQPAASCPVMVNGRGLPVGVQVVAHPGDDLLLLQLAREVEEAAAWQRTLDNLWRGAAGQMDV